VHVGDVDLQTVGHGLGRQPAVVNLLEDVEHSNPASLDVRLIEEFGDDTPVSLLTHRSRLRDPG
jgi:hypothetical protein